jgi:hypothetical protein
MAKHNRQLEDFRFLMEALIDDFKFMQHPGEMLNHPAYQEIVQMGDKAMKLILQEIKSGDQIWSLVYHCHRAGANVPSCYIPQSFVLNRILYQWTQMNNNQVEMTICNGRI